jgi:diguanylate cyclase (GGDEF)-like protein
MENSYALIPLLAAIAFLGPLAAVLFHRPRPKRNVLFLLFAIPAVLWSLSDFLLRSGFLPAHDLVLVKVVVCLGVLVVVQYHYFLRSHAGKQNGKALLAYLPLVAVIGLTISGYMPRSADMGPHAAVVRYGVWILPIALSLIALIAHDAYLLRRKWRASERAIERNQIAYLFAATVAGGAGILMGFTTLGTEYASPHVGNLALALIIAYAMVACQLADIGLALRRALTGFWVVAGTAAFAVLLLWLDSVFLGFEFTPSAAIAGVAGVLLCMVFVYCISQFSRRVIEGIFLGRRREYRQHLYRFLSTTAVITDINESGNKLLALLSQSIGSQRAWLLLPMAEDGGFEVRCIYASDGMESPSTFSLTKGSSALICLEREQRCLSRRELRTFPEFADSESIGGEKPEPAAVDMVFPVMNETRLVAILALGTKENADSYTLEDEEAVKAVLSSTSAIIEQAILRERMQAREEDLASLNQLVAIVTSSSDMRDAFDRFSQELQALAPVDLASITLADGDSLYLFALSTSKPSPWRTDQRIPLSGTGTEWVMRERRSLLEPDLAKERRFSTGEEYLRQGIRSVLHMPLISGDSSIGALIVASQQPEAYSGRSMALLEHLASAIARPIENSRSYARTREHARIDELTGLFNRRHFEERLKEELGLHTRHADSFSLLMLDLDSFKMFNDIFGHRAGDDLLRQVAGLITSSIRASDQAFRYGGDEFAVLLPRTEINVAGQVAERVRQEIDRHMQLASISVAASIGFANCPTNGVTASDLVTMADAALYHAKYHGGNRCSAATDMQPASQAARSTDTRGPNLAVVYALMAVVDARDHYTYAHSHKVRSFAATLAKAICLPADVVSRVGVASMLHDVGKIGTRDSVLATGKSATPEELEELRAHPRLGATIVTSVPGLAGCAPAILHHHEHYDGSGYPDGLTGEGIPLEARILAVADAFANMVSERGPQPALPWEEALEELKRHAGTWFDPLLAQAFVDAIIESQFAMESLADGSQGDPASLSTELAVPVENAQGGRDQWPK